MLLVIRDVLYVNGNPTRERRRKSQCVSTIPLLAFRVMTDNVQPLKIKVFCQSSTVALERVHVELGPILSHGKVVVIEIDVQ